MSLDSVRAFFAGKAPEIDIIELQTSTATVVLAAEAHGVEPGRIAKTLAFRVGEDAVLVVALSTAPYASPQSAWPSWWRRNGWMCARRRVEAKSAPAGGT